MIRLDGKYQCDICNKFATPANAAALGWDWFTGYRDKTFHYCQQCGKTHEREIARLRKIAYTKANL